MYQRFNPFRFAAFILLLIAFAVIVASLSGCNTEKQFNKYHDKQRVQAAKGNADKAKQYCNGWYPFTPINRVITRHDTTYRVTQGRDSIAYITVDCDTVKVNRIVRIPYRVTDTVDRLITLHDSTVVVDSVAVLDWRSKCNIQDKDIADLKHSRNIWICVALILLVVGIIIGKLSKK
jgi:hypothetical protein